ncbi:hypothetical protein ACS0TY_029862 [Phlomoides rotata]
MVFDGAAEICSADLKSCQEVKAAVNFLKPQANMLAAGLAAFNLVLYAFVYTPLKQIHPINTWVWGYSWCNSTSPWMSGKVTYNGHGLEEFTP